MLSNSIKVSTETATMSKKEDDATRSIFKSVAWKRLRYMGEGSKRGRRRKSEAGSVGYNRADTPEMYSHQQSIVLDMQALRDSLWLQLLVHFHAGFANARLLCVSKGERDDALVRMRRSRGTALHGARGVVEIVRHATHAFGISRTRAALDILHTPRPLECL